MQHALTSRSLPEQHSKLRANCDQAGPAPMQVAARNKESRRLPRTSRQRYCNTLIAIYNTSFPCATFI
jgi:hypothetical protein